MIDPDILRKDPDILRAALSKRGAPDITNDLLHKDQHLRSLKTQWQAAQEERGQLSKTIGAFLQAGDTASAEAAKARVALLKETLDALKAQQDQAQKGLQHAGPIHRANLARFQGTPSTGGRFFELGVEESVRRRIKALLGIALYRWQHPSGRSLRQGVGMIVLKSFCQLGPLFGKDGTGHQQKCTARL